VQLRWKENVENFERGLSTVIGDGLLCAGFLTYSGNWGFKTRGRLWSLWKSLLSSSSIGFLPSLSVVEYLSGGSDRLKWSGSYGLPTDNLCVENAIILSRCGRFPLVVDPSGQALSFLTAKYSCDGVVTSR